jgi:transposase InsO family protein
MDLDDRTRRALFRYGVIAPLVSQSLSKEQKKQVRKRILREVHRREDGEEWTISERTLCDWLKRHREKGFEGLYDANRGTYGTCRAIPESVLRAAAELRRHESDLSIAQILELLPFTEVAADESIDLCLVNDSTLNRQLNRLGVRKNVGVKEEGCHQRWQQKHVNDVWQGDTCDGPWLPDPTDPKKIKKTYMISFIDDASRLVPHAQFYFDTQLPSLLDCFRKALLKRGKPTRIYTDNAWIYHSTTLKLLCAQLDKITPSFSEKQKPPGRGKVERHIRTVQEGFMTIAKHSGINTLDELNQFFFAWLSGKYHKKKQEDLGDLSPIERWLVDKDRLVRVSPAEVRRGMMLRCQRTVNRKTATVRLDHVQYQVAVTLAGEKVEVRYHFNDASEVEIWQRGKMLEVARPVVVGANIDFSRRAKKRDEKSKGGTHPAFKAYRQFLAGNRTPECSMAMPGSLLTEQEFINVFEEVLRRTLSESEDESLRNFFGKYAPFEKTLTRSTLENIVEAAGARQHLRSYCERLLEAALYGYGGNNNG